MPLREPSKPSNQRMVCIGLGTLLCVLVGWHAENHLMWTRSHSLSHRLYWMDKVRPKDVKKGDYISFQLTDPLIDGGKAVMVTKQAACVAGEVLKTDGLFYYCGNEYLGKALERTPSGLTLKRFQYTGPIPAGKVFACGDSADSYDSRYWGFLNTSEVTDLAHPIW